jgi:hypothetical protein
MLHAWREIKNACLKGKVYLADKGVDGRIKKMYLNEVYCEDVNWTALTENESRGGYL